MAVTEVGRCPWGQEGEEWGGVQERMRGGALPGFISAVHQGGWRGGGEEWEVSLRVRVGQEVRQRLFQQGINVVITQVGRWL